MRAAAVAAFVFAAATAQAQGPAGPEFRVNTSTIDHQYAPGVAINNAGNFVMAWSSYLPGQQTTRVMARRYQAGGMPLGGEFVVKSAPRLGGFQYTSLSGTPVAMGADGRFVVAWTDVDANGAGAPWFRQFGADGTPAGPALPVTARGRGAASSTNVAMVQTGEFVVVWAEDVPGGADVMARRFDAGGDPVGVAFRVNTLVAGPRAGPRVAIDGGGGFVVVWQRGSTHPIPERDVSAQVFASDGSRIGGEFQVNTYTTGNQYVYSVAKSHDGRFVVAWDGPGDGSGSGVFAQRFDQLGGPIGAEFQVNVATAGSQSFATVASDIDFRLVFTWQSTAADGSGFGIQGRAFDHQGTPVGTEFRVNAYTTLSQDAANVAIDWQGNVVVTWHGDRQDGSDLGVFAQRFGGLHRGADVDEAAESSGSASKRGE